MYVVKHKTYNPAVDLLLDWYRGKDRPISAPTKRDEARTLGERYGRQSMLMDAVAAMLTVERIKRVAREDEPMVACCEGHEVQSVVKDMMDEYDNSIGLATREKPIAQMEAEFGEKLWKRLIDEVAYPEDIREMYFKRHKEDVLSRKVEPTEADREWLQEEFDKQRSITDELLSIMGKQEGQV